MTLKKSQFFLRLLIAQSFLLALGAGGVFLLPSTKSPQEAAQKRLKSLSSPEQAVTNYFLTINKGIRQQNLDRLSRTYGDKFDLLKKTS